MDGNNLEKLKSRLYKKEESFEERQKEARVYEEKTKLPSSYWDSRGAVKTPKIMKKFLITFFFLFLILAGFAAYFFLSGSNIISSRNINIDIKGPSYVEGGQISSFNIFIENQNKTALELADLIFDFPDNSFDSDGQPLTHERFSMGNINPGEIAKKPIDVSFFGLENEEKKINVTLEYRLADSNAIFAKNQEYTVKISRPPLGVSVSIPKEINSKQELTIKIQIVSNSDSVIKNASLQMAYPAGFQFISADPNPASQNNIWSLGDIGSLQKKEIAIKGFVEGQDLDEKAFNASAGVLDENGVLKSYGASAETLTIKRSPFYLSIFIEGQDVEKNIAKAGDSTRGDLQWVNNLPTTIRDAKIELSIKGDAQNEKTISVNQGSYRTFDKKLVWNSSTLHDLASIESGGSGRAQFSFSIQNPLPINSVNDKNFSIILEAVISGMGTSENFQNQEIADTVQKEIKIASQLQLTASALHYSGPFQNTGPMPPKIGEETTYTIAWSLEGNSNNFSNVKITSALPSYVRWLNVILPSDANVKFNERDGTIVWDAGNIPAGTGITSPSREIFFQIALAPNVGQIGSSPVIVNEAQLEAYDDFVEDIFNFKVPSLNTVLKYDEMFKDKEGKVVE